MAQPVSDNHKILDQDGYVLLVAVLVIGAVGISISTSLVLLGVGATRNGALVSTSMEAKALANACAERALQEIWNSASFTGSNTLTLGNGSCTYTVTNSGGENRLINASGTSGNAVRHVTLTVNEVTSTVGVSSWVETAD